MFVLRISSTWFVKGGGETDLRRNSWQIRLWQPDTAQRNKWNRLVINFVCLARRVFQKGAVFVCPALLFLDLSEWMGVYLNWIANPMYNTIHHWRNNRWSEKELGFGERDYLWISGERAPKRGKANIAGNSWKKTAQLRRRGRKWKALCKVFCSLPLHLVCCFKRSSPRSIQSIKITYWLLILVTPQKSTRKFA